VAARRPSAARLGGRNDITPATLTLTPDDLGVRITYLFGEPAPDRDFAVPYA